MAFPPSLVSTSRGRCASPVSFSEPSAQGVVTNVSVREKGVRGHWDGCLGSGRPVLAGSAFIAPVTSVVSLAGRPPAISGLLEGVGLVVLVAAWHCCVSRWVTRTFVAGLRGF